MLTLKRESYCPAAGLHFHPGRAERGAGGGNRACSALDGDGLAGAVCRLAHFCQLSLAGNPAERRLRPNPCWNLPSSALT